MKRSSFVVALALLWACASYQAPRFAITHYEQRGKFDGNGLKFVVMPDPGALQVEVAVRYDVGSSDDPDGKAGLAHLVEHLMFDVHPEGDTHSVQHYIERVATLWNAYTSYDATHYFAVMRPAQLDAVLQLEAIRLRDGCKSISEEQFEREREVVRNEIRQRTGTPEGQVQRILASALFPAGHPYARTVGGDDAQIAALTLADACAFMEHYYVPERATLIVAGRVDREAAISLIEKRFGGLARRSPAPRRPIGAITLTHATQTIDLDIDRPIVAVSWAIPPVKTVTDLHAQSEYYERLYDVRQAGVVYGFSTRVSTTTVGGSAAPVLTLIIELEDMSKVDQALDFVWKAVREGESVGAHRDAGSRLQSELVVGLEPLPNRVDHIAELVKLSPDEFGGHGSLLFHELDTVKSLDLHALEPAVRRDLDPDLARVTVFRPSRAGIKGDARSTFAFEPTEELSDADDVDVADASSALDVTKDQDALAHATRFQLDNGLHVVLLPIVSTLPVVTAKLIFDAGDAAAPENPMLASATARFAMPSPPTLYKLGRAGVGMGCYTTLDHTICSARTVGIYFHEALEGLERKFKVANIDQRSIELWQHQAAERGERRHRLAADELERQLLTALFGADHPYTKARINALGSERGISRDALYAFRDAHFRAGNATLIVVGAFDAEDAKTVIRSGFGNWERGTPAAATPPVAPRTSPAYVGVIRDAGPQVDVAIAYASPGGIGGDEATRRVLEQMIADAEKRVREQLGATYGTQVTRDARRGAGQYEVRASVDAARSGEALKAMRDAIDDLRHGTDFDQHFVRARRAVAQHLLDESSMSNDLASQLATIEEFGQPASYFEQLLQRVAVVTPADVATLLASELPPEHEVVVAAGDRETLVKAFAGAGLRDYHLVEPSGH